MSVCSRPTERVGTSLRRRLSHSLAASSLCTLVNCRLAPRKQILPTHHWLLLTICHHFWLCCVSSSDSLVLSKRLQRLPPRFFFLRELAALKIVPNPTRVVKQFISCVSVWQEALGAGSGYCHVCVMALLRCSFPHFSTTDSAR